MAGDGVPALLRGVIRLGVSAQVRKTPKAFLALSAIALCLMPPAEAAKAGFVRASGTRFVVDGRPFVYAGTNCYYLMTRAADPAKREAVDEVLNKCAAMGLTVVRTWAFCDGPGANRLQTAPGKYNERVLRGLDYVLHRASRLGLRLVLVLVNNHPDYGGMAQYLKWAGLSKHGDFYTDDRCRRWYKQFAAMLIGRVNNINGRRYRDDPAIFSWELANEPSNEGEKPDVLDAWIREMSSYVKSLDPNQMVAAGVEGYYASGGKNPASWMEDKGTDFVSSQIFPSIDYAVAHSYPLSWGVNTAGALNLLRAQIADAHNVLKKPFVLEEFGRPRPVKDRDRLYQAYFDVLHELRAAGWNFWILYHDAYPDYDGYGVYYPADSSTISIIRNQVIRSRRALSVGPQKGERKR